MWKLLCKHGIYMYMYVLWKGGQSLLSTSVFFVMTWPGIKFNITTWGVSKDGRSELPFHNAIFMIFEVLSVLGIVLPVLRRYEWCHNGVETWLLVLVLVFSKSIWLALLTAD